MIYDGDGDRTGRTEGGVVTRYLVDDLTPTGYAQVAEELQSAVVVRRYAYGTQRVSQTQLINGVWTTHYYGYDAGFSVRQLTDSVGAATDTYTYDAFGNRIEFTGSTPNLFLYRGEEYNFGLDLYYLLARYATPAGGRFLTADPIEGCALDPLALHRYLYANADPVNRKDPRGLAAASENTGAMILTLAVLATAATYEAQTHAASNLIKKIVDESACVIHKSACFLTSLADKNGRTYGAERCEECYDHCIQTGRWPPRAPRSTGGSVRCDYWNYPSQE